MMSLRRSVVLAVFLGAVVAVPMGAHAQEAPPDGHVIEGLMHPESVARRAEQGTFYVSNIGEKLAPNAKDGDGFISRLSADGALDVLRYLPAPSSDAVLHAPKGTVVLNGHLYTADVDRIVGFALADRSKSTEISLAEKGVSFLNDISMFDSQTLFVSASDQGKIYRIDLEGETATALDVPVPGVNGLAYSAEEGRLFAVSFGGDAGGRLWTLDVGEAGTVSDASSRILEEGAGFDGIAIRPDGDVIISSWGVKGASDPTPALYRVTGRGTGAISTIELTEWEGPADFTCVPEGGCWIPDLPASAVKVVFPDERQNE